MCEKYNAADRTSEKYYAQVIEYARSIICAASLVGTTPSDRRCAAGDRRSEKG